MSPNVEDERAIHDIVKAIRSNSTDHEAKEIIRRLGSECYRQGYEIGLRDGILRARKAQRGKR